MDSKILSCNTCHTSKPSSEFYPMKCTRGFAYACKECANAKYRRIHRDELDITRADVENSIEYIFLQESSRYTRQAGIELIIDE